MRKPSNVALPLEANLALFCAVMGPLECALAPIVLAKYPINYRTGLLEDENLWLNLIPIAVWLIVIASVLLVASVGTSFTRRLKKKFRDKKNSFLLSFILPLFFLFCGGVWFLSRSIAATPPHLLIDQIDHQRFLQGSVPQLLSSIDGEAYNLPDGTQVSVNAYPPSDGNHILVRCGFGIVRDNRFHVDITPATRLNQSTFVAIKAECQYRSSYVQSDPVSVELLGD